VNVGEVLAGENSTTPAFAIWSMTVSEVLDDSAPRMAVAPPASSAVTDWVAMFVEVSPESFWVMLL
jgi:hypothetical protein